jgi:hypothetical protein
MASKPNKTPPSEISAEARVADIDLAASEALITQILST